MEEPPKLYYRAFTLDTPPDEARAAFRTRFGYEAAEVFPSLGNLLAGPVSVIDAQAGR